MASSKANPAPGVNIDFDEEPATEGRDQLHLWMTPEEATAAHVSAARSQRLGGDERLAIQTLEVATHLRADATISFELALAHRALGRTHRALKMLDTAIGLDPTFREAHWTRGLLLEGRGQVDEAMASWRKADVFDDPLRHSLFLVATLKSPHATNTSILATNRDWASRHALQPDGWGRADFPSWQPDQRIHLAYTSSFWDAEVMRYQIFPILRRHNRDRFKVTAYVPGNPGPDLPGAVDEIISVRDVDDAAFVPTVRSNGTHVLVELNGHSPGHRFAAMGARCAPVQVSYFNNIGTSGVAQVDYLFGDAISIPPRDDGFYTEQVYRLPRCFFCATYDPAELPPVEPPPSLRNGYATFGCFSSAAKINPEVIGFWAQMLHRVPGSRFFIRNGDTTPPDNRDALARQFESHGIARERLLILPGTSRQGVLESYAQVDVALDTYPYCGGNTSAEALWQGVPVVTLTGDRFATAYGAAVLVASGLGELVATTPDEYVSLAAELALDPSRLAYYRDHLRTMVMTHGFSNAETFTASIDDAYLDMMSRSYAR
jgi:predicted O-linked N-acetylglucosamine transferase (SPINDLY family)